LAAGLYADPLRELTVLDLLAGFQGAISRQGREREGRAGKKRGKRKEGKKQRNLGKGRRIIIILLLY